MEYLVVGRASDTLGYQDALRRALGDGANIHRADAETAVGVVAGGTCAGW